MMPPELIMPPELMMPPELVMPPVLVVPPEPVAVADPAVPAAAEIVPPEGVHAEARTRIVRIPNERPLPLGHVRTIHHSSIAQPRSRQNLPVP
jgi:hypothetical protein